MVAQITSFTHKDQSGHIPPAKDIVSCKNHEPRKRYRSIAAPSCNLIAIREIQNALFEHQTDTAIELIESHGLSVDTVAHNGLTFLMYASQQNNFVAVRKLVAKGADINHVNDESRVPALWFAFTSARNLELAEYLLANGSITEMRYCDRDGLLDWLTYHGYHKDYISRVEALLSKYRQ